LSKKAWVTATFWPIQPNAIKNVMVVIYVAWIEVSRLIWWMLRCSSEFKLEVRIQKNVMTLSITALNITPFSIMVYNITTFSITVFSITKLSIKSSFVILSIEDTLNNKIVIVLSVAFCILFTKCQCGVSLWRMSICWVTLCWVSWRIKTPPAFSTVSKEN
jgi:hypothetical protein